MFIINDVLCLVGVFKVIVLWVLSGLCGVKEVSCLVVLKVVDEFNYWLNVIV